MKEDITIVTWSEKYAVGIELIDNQHRELVNLTNKLYQASRINESTLSQVFKDAMSQMVEYVRFHFTAELELLKRIKYPEYEKHKNLHDVLVKQILDSAKAAGEGKKFIPYKFTNDLKDWVFGHIAIFDQNYAAYVRDQKKKGLLTNAQLMFND
jgi:hemerythrin-like metal-binding protein